VRSSEGTEQLLSVSQYTGVTQRRRSNGGDDPDTRAESLVGYKCVEPDELVVNIMLAWNGSMGVSRYTGIASPAYCVYRFQPEANPWYFHYLLRSMCYKTRVKVLSTGVVESRLRLYTDDLYRLEALVPPLPDQEAIVRYLDYTESRIRSYLRAKQRLLQLQTEQRVVATNQILELPGTRSMRVCEAAERESSPIERDDNRVYTPIGLLNRGRGIFHKMPTLGRELGDSTFFVVREGDFVLSGQFAWEGAVALATQEDAGCVATHRYPILRAKPAVAESAYLLSFFQTSMGQLLLDQHSRGAAGRNRPLNARTLMKERIPIPPLDAQRRISEMVELENRMRRTVARSVELLGEFRTRLIDDIVTGRLDVRDAAAKLPNEHETLTDDDGLSMGDDADELAEEAAILEEVDA